jgi:hypothetical protein
VLTGTTILSQTGITAGSSLIIRIWGKTTDGTHEIYLDNIAVTGAPLYLETFTTSTTKGITGPCTSSSPGSCAINDLSGVDWTVGGPLNNAFFNAGDFLRTTNGRLIFNDSNVPTYWQSPGIATSAGSLIDISLDVEYKKLVNGERLDVTYSTDGGSTFTSFPPSIGGGSNYAIEPKGSQVLTGTTILSQTGITAGSSLILRIWGKTTDGKHEIYLDNIAVSPSGLLGDRVVSVDAGICEASVFLGTPIVSDNCGSVTTTNDAPAIFPVGQTTVTWTVTDAAGNTATCTQLIRVSADENEPPMLSLNGANPQEICQGTSYTEEGATATDNCTANPVIQINSSSLDVNTEGIYTITYTATDDAGNTATASRLVIVKFTPPALEQENCPNNNPTCNQIRVDVCPYQEAPDLVAVAMSNAAYVPTASLSWYDFNGQNNPPGTQLSGPPSIDMETPQSTTNVWVTQTINGCESAPTQMRVRVKADLDPNLTLDFTGISLPTCGGATVDFLSAVSGYDSRVTGFMFYKGKPNQGGTLLSSTTGATVANVNDPYFYAPLANGTNDYYVQSIMRNANQCGGEASDEVALSVTNPVIVSFEVVNNGVSTGVLTSFPQTVSYAPGPISFEFTTSNAQNLFLLASNGGSGYVPVANNSFTILANIVNLGSFVWTAIPYNGNCAGQPIVINFVCSNCRSTQASPGDLSSLLLSAASLNEKDVALAWDFKLGENDLFGFNGDFETIELQKEVAPGQYETFHTQAYAGEGKYSYTDMGGMDEVSRYRVLLVTADGSAMISNEAEVRAGGVLNPNAFSLFPNPTTDRVQIQALFPIEEPLSWQLTDMVGKTVMQGMMQEAEMSLDLSRLANGVYQFVTNSRDGVRTVNRVVKQ